MTRKILFIAIIVISLLAFTLASCGTNDKDIENNDNNNVQTNDKNSVETNDEETNHHTHAFGEWQVVKEATCTEDGSKERVCSCGEKETVSIEKTAHTYGEWQTVKEATCTEDGSKERVCSCGEKETDIITAVGHYEVIDAAVESSCNNYGLTEGSHCENCGEIIIPQTEIEPSHNAPYGVCNKCNKVIDGDLAADTYVGIRSNALNQYITTYYDGSMFAKYSFYDYDLDINVSNTYDGKIHVYVTLDLTAQLINSGSYYSGIGFVSYDVKMNGYTIESGYTDVSYNTASISWSMTLNSINYLQFELYLSDYYM